MNWRYKSGEKIMGPVSRAELLELRRSGAITKDTLVLCTGLPDWVSYNDACPESVEEADADKSGAATGIPKVHKSRASSHVVAPAPIVQARWAATYTQPVVHPPPPLPLRPAGFWIRFGAKIIDGLFVSLVSFLICCLWLVAAHGVDIFAQPSEKAKAALPDSVSALALVGVLLGYSTACHGLIGATLGKKVFGLRLTTMDNAAVTLWRAGWRIVAEVLVFLALMMVFISMAFFAIKIHPIFVLMGALFSWPFSCLGYAVAAFNRHKRGLHDFLAGTRVVRL